MRNDRETSEDVARELAWDRHVDESGIRVSVAQGRVVLAGTVASWAVRLCAEEAAQRVVGVLEVDNELQVKPAPCSLPTDADIAQAVRVALEWDVFLADARVRSSVSDGQVTLEGEVQYCSQWEKAGRAVRHVVGVRRVLNRIQVKPEAAAPHEIQRDIEAALERQVGSEARRINLDVHEGKVIVSGFVHSWAERRLVIGAAKGTRGVRSVDDRLHIEP